MGGYGHLLEFLLFRLAFCGGIQAVAACLWIAYGVTIGAPPVVIANVIVAVAALYSLWRSEPQSAEPAALN